jgi:polygalacturonase
MFPRAFPLPFALAAIALALAARAAPAPDPWRDEVPAILARIVAPTFPSRDFPITDYGAKPGGADARAALAQALAACAAAGGGRVVIPAGEFFCAGPVHLQSHVNLHLAEGSVLKFGADPAHYLPLVLTRWEGTELMAHSPRIYARDATGIAITGRGIIDGNARETLALMKSQKPGDGSAALRQMGAAGTPVAERRFGADRWLRPSMIQPFNCTGVLIEGVTVRDSTFWCVHPTLCRNVTVRGLTVESLNANNDGCDPDSCADVLIEDCTFATGDDAIAIKSGRDQDGWRVGRPSENIVIRRCVMRSRHSALCIGSEMSGGVRNVFLEDCTLSSVSSAFYFKANLDRRGVVEHVRARRLSADQVREGFVRFETGYHGYRGENHPPVFRDFVIEDLTCREATAYGLYLEGVPAAPIRDVIIRRATIDQATVPLWLRQFENLRLEDVKINGVLLPATPPASPADAIKLKISS